MNKLEPVQHNLNVAKPVFIDFIESIAEKHSKWIQYKGFEIEGDSRLIFLFKSSQNSLSFKVYAGVYTGEHLSFKLNSRSGEIMDFFRELKYQHIK